MILCDMDIFNGYLVLFFNKRGLPLLCSLKYPMQIDFKHLNHLILMNMPRELQKRQRILQYDNTKEFVTAFPFLIPLCTQTPSRVYDVQPILIEASSIYSRPESMVLSSAIKYMQCQSWFKS
ncbi:hypothetical protein E2542_SST05786 [Spatholobus suberectus]|nr:hypothetical protein E2542_SST05786 [Spatholobus suberectus]